MTLPRLMPVGYGQGQLRLLSSFQALSCSLAQFVAREEAAFIERGAAAFARLNHLENIIGGHCAWRGQSIAVGNRFLVGEGRQCLPLGHYTGGILCRGFGGQLTGCGVTRCCATGKAGSQQGANKDTKCRHLQLTNRDTGHSTQRRNLVPINQGRGAFCLE